MGITILQKSREECVKAIKEGNVEKLKELLSDGMLSRKVHVDNELLHTAMDRQGYRFAEHEKDTRRLKIPMILVDAGADINSYDRYTTPIMSLVASARYPRDYNDNFELKPFYKEYIEEYIKKGANVKALDTEGNSILRYSKSTDEDNFFINKGVDVTTKNKKGETILDNIVASYFIDNKWIIDWNSNRKDSAAENFARVTNLLSRSAELGISIDMVEQALDTGKRYYKEILNTPDSPYYWMTTRSAFEKTKVMLELLESYIKKMESPQVFSGIDNDEGNNAKKDRTPNSVMDDMEPKSLGFAEPVHIDEFINHRVAGGNPKDNITRPRTNFHALPIPENRIAKPTFQNPVKGRVVTSINMPFGM